MKKACDKPPGGSQDSPLSPFLGRSFITHAEMMGRLDPLRVTGVFAKFRVSVVPALHAFYQRFKRVHQSSCPAPSIPASIPSPGLLKQKQTVKRHGQGGTLELSQEGHWNSPRGDTGTLPVPRCPLCSGGILHNLRTPPVQGRWLYRTEL